MYIAFMLIAILILVLLSPYIAYALQSLTFQEDMGFKVSRVIVTIMILATSIGCVFVYNLSFLKSLPWIAAIIIALVIYATDTIPFVRKLLS